jgi:prevent-host-death family protein
VKSTSVGAFDAKTHLSQLLDRVEHGEEIEITRRGRAIARLVPSKPAPDANALHALARQVKEERGSYGVTSRDIAAWKSEGRR